MGVSSQEQERLLKEALELSHQGDAPSPTFRAMWGSEPGAAQRAAPPARAWRVGAWSLSALALSLLGVSLWLGPPKTPSLTTQRAQETAKERAAAPLPAQSGDEEDALQWESPTDFLLAESEQVEQWSVEEPLESWQIWQEEPRQGAQDEEQNL